MNTELGKTIPFLPNRLNKDAIAWMGLTMPEFVTLAMLGVFVGLFIGLLLFLFTGYWVLMPVLALLLCFFTPALSARYIARVKRGKPEAYFNRLIAFKLDEWSGGKKFIRRKGYWAIRKQKGKLK